MVRIAFLETSVCSLFLSSLKKKHTQLNSTNFSKKKIARVQTSKTPLKEVFFTLKALGSFER